ncbi:uncharacterized protein BKA78DRAFT_326291 [Phyllosticta capitalensis]|uniref:uncharacterized protein n=1 Tax=Phyllosticta capitalensis TaxID=121624 RepID=UPI0031308F01
MLLRGAGFWPRWRSRRWWELARGLVWERPRMTRTSAKSAISGAAGPAVVLSVAVG